jgi:adenylylsulfate kinase
VVSHYRHIAKAVSWRIIGTLDTMLIGWLISGSLTVGAAIGGMEVITKTFLYYAHERVWYKHIRYGISDE